MKKPKKAIIATSKKEVDEVVKTEETKETTSIKSVKVDTIKDSQRHLRKGDLFLFIKDGLDVYYTRATANVIFQRNSASMVIPKGSEYIPPKGSKCDGCE